MSDSLITKQSMELVDVKNFSGDEMKRIQAISQEINITDTQGVITFGISAQKDVSEFADTILQQVRSKDSGYVGDVLTDLVIKVKDLKVDSLSGNGSFLGSIPIVGNFLDAVKRFIMQYEKVSVQIEKIVEELDKARMTLLRDITLLDGMYDKNAEYLKNLDFFIAAGQIRLKELKETMLVDLKKIADETNDPADAQRLQDFTQALNRFEKKIHDLKLSRMIAIQTSPQLRLIQNNDQALVEKIQSSILNTIPLWKNQMVIAITLFRQKKAVKLQREVTQTTNDLLLKNSELLKMNSIDVAKEMERGIVDIETLKKVNSDLISTIEETLKIQQEGKAKRAQAEQDLVQMENELKSKLKSAI